MKVIVLSSGSKGNCTYIETKNYKFLIDIGTSSLYVEKKLKELGIEPNEINGIFISHTHVDHIAGLRVFLKKHNTLVYCSEKMYQELNEQMMLREYYIIDGDFDIDDIHVTVLKTSHDTEDSNGYVIEEDGVSVVYVTDTGYISEKNKKKLTDKTIYIMESNHDLDMLMHGRYPYPVKMRIMGDRGHLSNVDSAKCLAKVIGEHTKYIILAHLSEENNTDELAYETLIKALETSSKTCNHIYIAHQNEETEMVEV